MLSSNTSRSLGWAAWLFFVFDACTRFGPVLFQADMALYLLFGRSNGNGNGKIKGWKRTRYRLLGSEAPTVDIFVTCRGESMDLILNTVQGAARQDYPAAKYRVFLLDDAASSELRGAIARYNAQRPRGAQEIRYLSRAETPGKPRFYKAGNLAFGIQESASVSEGTCSEYIAALDADAIPEPDWLRRLVPHLVLDGRLAAVVPGLRHYNLPEGDPLMQNIATPWDISIEHMRDAMGVTNLYGSGYVIRRVALDSIGGWPLVPSAEDLYCGHLLAGAGWDIAFCWDICQHDLTPGSLDALVSQRLRWTEGDFNLARRFNFFLPGLDPCRARSVARRATAILSSLRLYKGLLDTLSLLLLTPVLLATLQPRELQLGRPGLESSDRSLRALTLITLLFDKCTPFLTSGLLDGRTTSVTWFTPFEALATVRLHLPRTMLSFTPTGTVMSGANERSARFRKRTLDRFRSRTMLFYVVYVALSACSLGGFLFRMVSWFRGTAVRGAGGGWGGVHLIQSSFFTPTLVVLIECIAAMSVPLVYMAWPPTVPERGELLERREGMALRPRGESASRGGSGASVLMIAWVDLLQIGVALVVDWVLCGL
ncbi:nucleotide-diphospho-sugar transferase [Aspergillus filifer]